ncbi:MAG: hypothetical protein HY080_13970 [Gammaproteobacteria bacterium]|nr:hypothetical protein [Gammaproteobacteria bacterium]
MKLLKLSLVLGLVTFLGFSNLVLAAGQGGPFYVGAMVGNASYDYGDVNNSTPTQFYFGYRKPDSIFGFEAAYVDLGDADVTSLSGVSLRAHGYNISGVYHSPNSRASLGFMLKAGFYSFDTDLKVAGMTILTSSGSGLSLGGGVDYAMNQYLSFRAELQGFVGVKDFANNSSVFSGNIGVEVHF